MNMEAFMVSSKILADIDSFISANQEELFRNIGRLVAINSINGPEQPNAPFGKGPAEALYKTLEIAEELGLSTRNCEDRIGYAFIKGSDSEAEKYLATITHVDIVPAGNGWNSDPFTMIERDGYILGRGVIDDKGPSILCLYALKYFRNRGINPKYEIRALIGSNEEIGMSDVEYYLDHYPAPVFCFSPDADFPLVNGEKGIWHAVLTSKLRNSKIEKIWGGLAANAVPDRAEAIICLEDGSNGLSLSHDDRIETLIEGNALRLIAYGIGGHASLPAGTENAIGILASYILENHLASDEEESFLLAVMKLHSASDGSGLGIQASDGLFDPLTAVGGVIGMTEDGRMYQTIDIRYPTSTTGAILSDTILSQVGSCAELTVTNDTVPFYMSLDNPAVQVCINAYNSVTGENAVPFTIGGGTYARHFPNATSFGPEHNDRKMPDWCGSMHGANEAASKADFLEALKVYIVALLELEGLDF